MHQVELDLLEYGVLQVRRMVLWCMSLSHHMPSLDNDYKTNFQGTRGYPRISSDIFHIAIPSF